MKVIVIFQFTLYRSFIFAFPLRHTLLFLTSFSSFVGCWNGVCNPGRRLWAGRQNKQEAREMTWRQEWMFMKFNYTDALTTLFMKEKKHNKLWHLLNFYVALTHLKSSWYLFTFFSLTSNYFVRMETLHLRWCKRWDDSPDWLKNCHPWGHPTEAMTDSEYDGWGIVCVCLSMCASVRGVTIV